MLNYYQEQLLYRAADKLGVDTILEFASRELRKREPKPTLVQWHRNGPFGLVCVNELGDAVGEVYIRNAHVWADVLTPVDANTVNCLRRQLFDNIPQSCRWVEKELAKELDFARIKQRSLDAETSVPHLLPREGHG